MATVITASRATARIALGAAVMACLRSLSLVDWRSLAGGEVERAAIRGLTEQGWRIDLVVGEPTLPVAGYEDGTVDPGNLDVAIWHPSIGRRRGWCGRYPGHRARRRATKTVEHRTPRRGTSGRCHQPARGGWTRGDAKHDYRGQQHRSQPHHLVPLRSPQLETVGLLAINAQRVAARFHARGVCLAVHPYEAKAGNGGVSLCRADGTGEALATISLQLGCAHTKLLEYPTLAPDPGAAPGEHQRSHNEPGYLMPSRRSPSVLSHTVSTAPRPGTFRPYVDRRTLTSVCRRRPPDHAGCAFRHSGTGFPLVRCSQLQPRDIQTVEEDHDESTHKPNGGRALPPADHPARQGASALRDRGSIANRARRVSLSRQRRQPQPAPGRHHDPPRHVQEAPLASERADLLSAPPALRQALQRAGPAGRRHRRAHPIAGWREHRHGPRRGRDDADPAPATRTRGSPSAALEAASRPRDRPEGSPCDGAAGGRGGR